MKEILEMHFKRYPQMKIQDAVKLIYQSEFGPGHLLKNTAYAEKLLKEEIEMTKEDYPEIVPISDRFVRLHLGHMNQDDVENLLEAMMKSAEASGSMKYLTDKLEILKSMHYFPVKDVEEYLNDYLKRDSLMISHTEEYRAQYHPHYRVLLKDVAESLMVKKEK